MNDLVNNCLSLTSLSHLAARESGKCVLLVEYTVARKAISGSIVSVIGFLFVCFVLFCSAFQGRVSLQTGLPWSSLCTPALCG